MELPEAANDTARDHSITLQSLDIPRPACSEVYINWQALLWGNSLLLPQPFRSFIHSFTPIP
jgi:hypothetical protein